MNDKKSSEWIWPPMGQWLAHWAVMVMALIGMITSGILSFFHGLTGASWIWLYFIAVGLGASGGALIFWAKLPCYRERRFLTFGASALPEGRRIFYRWGYRCVIASAALFTGLLLSHH